ncbi:MAG: tRNA (5-methylaminomethyl-2-thiouridine)(34)-methyltransferase MnmD [Salibacteraceae bacterium]
MAREELIKELVISADGSHTIKVPDIKEHYHSHKGAVQESEHVFIRMGLNALGKSANVSILEVGFGTGLNALLTALNMGDRSIHYTGLEPYPLKPELLSQLNYPEVIGGNDTASLFDAIHSVPYNEPQTIKDSFILEKRQCVLQSFDTKVQFDLIYYDAFAPHAQPELWYPSIWTQLRGLMKQNALLVTYCAKGQVRRDMQSVGLEVDRLPGPPGKREMLRAINRTP